MSSNPRKTTVRQAVHLSLTLATIASLGVAAPTLAAEDEAELDEVVITGTRIAKRDAVAESPILTVDSETLDNSGYTAIEGFLNTLPQVTANLSSQSNNPSSGGQAFIDLRGLGISRNLVLIDGRRAMGSTSGGSTGAVGAVDVNTIPAALIDRVEVISGGAAAVYGSDAVAGVVNFILKNRFTGVEMDANYGITEMGDGIERGADITVGGNFADGRGNAVFNMSYYKRDDMYKDARDFSAQASSATGTFPGGSFTAGTSGITQAEVDGLFGAGNCSVDASFGFNPDGSLFCVGTPGSTAYQIYGFEGPESWIATQFAPDYFSYNFEPDNILVLPMERWNFFTRTEFEVNEHFTPYGQAMFTNYNAKSELAPTPGSVTGIPATNPFIPPELAALLALRTSPGATFSIGKRFNSLGGRTSYNEHDVWQLVGGAKGVLAGSWGYDVFAQYGRSVQTEIQGGNVRVPRVTELVTAADGGASLCEGGLNLFGMAPISAACQARISLEAKNLNVVEQRSVEAIITGDLFMLPAGPVQTAFGVSARDISLDFRPDGGLQPGQVIGFNEQLPVSGSLSYKDYFAEFSIPVLPSVTLSPALRFTDNNRTGTEETWKITADWSVINGVRVRGGFQRAVRSPNVKELFAPQTNQFPTVTDPCQGVATPQIKALCGLQYAPAGAPGFNSGFGQAQAIGGGNPNLSVETADTWTAGLVFTSGSANPWLADATMTIDYFNIKLEDVIASVEAQTIVNRCYNADNQNPTFALDNFWCNQFERDPDSNGRISNLEQFSSNQAFIKVSGVDMTLDYGIPAPESIGAFGMTATVSYLDSYKTQTGLGAPIYEYKRTIGTLTGSAKPQWRGTLTTSWAMGPASAVLTSRFIDTMYHANIVQTPTTVATGAGKTWYFDLAGNFDLTDKVSLRLGVNNLTDKGPQIYAPNIQANTDPSTYDVLGRRYFGGVNVRF